MLSEQPIDLDELQRDLERLGWQLTNRTDFPEIIMRYDIPTDRPPRFWVNLHASRHTLRVSLFLDSAALGETILQSGVSLQGEPMRSAWPVLTRHLGHAVSDTPAPPAVARWLATEGDDGLIELEAAARFWLMSPTRSHMPTIDAVVHRLIAALGETTNE